MDDSTTPDRPVPPVAVPDPHTGEALPPALDGMRPEAVANASVRPEQDEPGGPLGGLLGASAAQTAIEATPGAHVPDPQQMRPEAVANPEAWPGLNEPGGPLKGLVGASAAQISAEADPAEAALLANMGVESEGIESGQLLGLILSVIVGIAALGVGLILLFYIPTRQQAGNVASDVVQYPELEQVRTDGRAKTKLFTRTDSTYQIPIANAMSAVAGRYHESAAPAGLPSTRQQWNTLMLNRGMGTTVQTLNGRQGAATVENQRLEAESEGATGARAGAPAPAVPVGTTDEQVGVDGRTSTGVVPVPANAPPVER